MDVIERFVCCRHIRESLGRLFERLSFSFSPLTFPSTLINGFFVDFWSNVLLVWWVPRFHYFCSATGRRLLAWKKRKEIRVELNARGKKVKKDRNVFFPIRLWVLMVGKPIDWNFPPLFCSLRLGFSLSHDTYGMKSSGGYFAQKS